MLSSCRDMRVALDAAIASLGVGAFFQRMHFKLGFAQLQLFGIALPMANWTSVLASFALPRAFSTAGNQKYQRCCLIFVHHLLLMSHYVPITNGLPALWGASQLRTWTFPWALPSCRGFSYFAWGATDCLLNRAAFCKCQESGMCVACVAQANLGMSGTCQWNALPCLT